MRYKAGHKEEAHARMIAAAGRGFRRRGFGGIGVDGLAKEAEVTSGAFYGHFPSKEAAFREAVAAGIEELRSNVVSLRETHGANWLEVFVDFYLSYKRTCDLGDSCALQSLSPEVGRSDAQTRAVYEAGLANVVDAVAAGLEGGSLGERKQRAWVLLSLLSGGVTQARAVEDEKVSSSIAASIRAAALKAVQPGARAVDGRVANLIRGRKNPRDGLVFKDC